MDTAHTKQQHYHTFAMEYNAVFNNICLFIRLLVYTLVLIFFLKKKRKINHLNYWLHK